MERCLGLLTKVIKCELYDYFEIACMRRSSVLLELHNGESLSGVAFDLTSKDGKEFVVLKADDADLKINLKDITVLVFAKSGERINIS